MSDNVNFDIYIDVVNSNAFRTMQNNASNAHKKINKEVSKTSSVYGNLKNQLVGLAGGVGVGMLIKDTVMLGAKLEQTAISFEVMLGSATKAKEMMGDINEFANSTPYGNADLMKAAKTMMSFGIESESVLGTLKKIGDVASGDANQFQRLTTVFSKIKSAGKMQGDDLNQLIDATFNPLPILEKKLGKTQTEIRKMMSKGLISSDLVEEAFSIATSEGGQFHNSMIKQSTTLIGLWSTLTGKISTIAAEMSLAESGGLKDMVKRLIEMTDWLNENRSVIKKTVKGLWTIAKAVIAYKVATAASNMVMKVARIAQVAYRLSLIATQHGLKGVARAQKATNTVMKANPFGLIMGAISLLIPVIISLFEKNNELTESQKKVNKELANTRKIARDLAAIEVDILNIDALNPRQKNESLSVLNESLKELEDTQKRLKIESRNSEPYKDLVNAVALGKKAKTGLEKAFAAGKTNKARTDLDAYLKSTFGFTENELISKMKQVKSDISKFVAAGATSTIGISATPELNKLQSELSTQRNIRNVTINIDKQVGIETMNNTSIQEGAQEIERLILEALNKTTAAYAVQN